MFPGKPDNRHQLSNVLLINADRDEQIAFKAALRVVAPSVNCDTVVSATAALHSLATNLRLPQLVFLDLGGQGFEGHLFLIRKKNYPQLNNVAVGIVSHQSLMSDMHSARNLGAKFYLTLSGDFGILCRQLQKIMGTDYSRSQFSITIA